jgi:DNA polymerase-3 subunit delta'
MTTLADIVGHDRAVRRFRTAVVTGRPAHAYLVTGPVGVGKGTLADAFTASLLCDAPRDGDACGSCPQCTRVEADTHPDVRRVTREEDRRDIRTEQARDVTRWLTLRPLMASRKVAVIDDAECLNEHGQNSLLKTLEEPPGSSVLLLLAAHASLLLPTVRSRCQRVRLDPLPSPLLDRLLADRGVAAEVRATVVPRAEGSPGRAVALLDDPRGDARLRMLTILGRFDSAAAHELSAVAQALGRDDADVALETALSWYRDLLTVVAGDADGTLRNVDAMPALRTVAARTSVPAVLGALETVCDTIRAVEQNANRVLALETMLLALRRRERAARTEHHVG